jgi:hypothetical protein
MDQREGKGELKTEVEALRSRLEALGERVDAVARGPRTIGKAKTDRRSCRDELAHTRPRA